VHHVVQRLGWIAALRHQPADFLQRPEHRALVSACLVANAHGPSASMGEKRKHPPPARLLPGQLTISGGVFRSPRLGADICV
jgi:hypothetical protein